MSQVTTMIDDCLLTIYEYRCDHRDAVFFQSQSKKAEVCNHAFNCLHIYGSVPVCYRKK